VLEHAHAAVLCGLAAILASAAMVIEDVRGVRADDRHGPRYRCRIQ